MTAAPTEDFVEQKVSNLLFVGPVGSLTSEQLAALKQAGWTVAEHDSPGTLPSEFWQGHQVVIIAAKNRNAEEIARVLTPLAESDAAAFLPILPPNCTREDVLRLVRLGVADILIQPISKQEFLDAVARVNSHHSLYTSNLSYSRKLERANKELRESLNILKMDHIAGRQVQKSLMPHEPIRHRGYTITHTIIPSLYLSGDFVAYQLTFDRFILFFIADVSGHGASSAFVTILLRFLLKRIIRKHVRENDMRALLKAPEGFMEHVNRQLLATGLEKQVTMFGGAIDTETSLMRYAVAAQMPMPIFVSGNDARFLPGKGKVLGLFEDASWEIDEIYLPERFTLVMVSDGLLETLPGKGLEQQQHSMLETLARTPANHEDICRALGVENLKEVADDVTVLTITRGKVT